VCTCAKCGEELHPVGTAFRAPRRENADQWRKVEFLIRNGFHFQRGEGAYPKTLRAARRFVKDERLDIRGEGTTQNEAHTDAQVKALRRFPSYLLGGLRYTPSGKGWTCHITVTRYNR